MPPRELPDSRLQSLQAGPPTFRRDFFRAEMLFTTPMPAHKKKPGGRRVLANASTTAFWLLACACDRAAGPRRMYVCGATNSSLPLVGRGTWSCMPPFPSGQRRACRQLALAHALLVVASAESRSQKAGAQSSKPPAANSQQQPKPKGIPGAGAGGITGDWGVGGECVLVLVLVYSITHTRYRHRHHTYRITQGIWR